MPTFAHPLLLILALAAPLAVWALHRHAVRARAQAWAALAPGGLRAGLTGAQPWMRGRRAAAVAVAAALVAVALARPQVAGGEETVEREGLDLVVALDVSQSMLAEDVAPSRLERARAEVRRLADALPGDRLGLVVFAGDAFVQCPLTSDHAAFRLFLDAASPDMLPTQGTDFEAALAAAADAFGPPPAERRVSEGGVTTAPPAAARVVLVVSDGENHDGRIARARALARDAGAVVFTAGVGESEGVPIPAFVDGQRVGNKVDPESGEEVRSRLETDALRELASDGGAYVHVGRLESGLGDLPEQLSGMQRGVIAAATMGRRAEAFMWPLALALLVLAAEALVPDARRRGALPVVLADAAAPAPNPASAPDAIAGSGGEALAAVTGTPSGMPSGTAAASTRSPS